MAEATSAAPDDKITGPFSDALVGRTVEYRYSTGNHYRMAFGHERLTFLQLNAPEPHEPVPLAYLARELRPGQYLVHWAVKPANIHVALVFDLDAGTVHVSALMPGGWEFFDSARIVSSDSTESNKVNSVD
jgi:MoaF N-terminal domain